MRRVIAVLALVASPALACASGSSSDRPLVVATVWPFAWLAEQVAPGADVRVVPANAGADPHDVQLTPTEVQAIRDADAILYVGDVGYQPAVEQVIADTTGRAIAAVEGNGDDDPHVWHRPTVLAGLIGPLVAALADVDVLDRDRIIDLPEDLSELQTASEELLRSCPRKEVVVSHAGYAPLLEPLGIEQHAISGPREHAEPTAAGLSDLADEIREDAVPAILAEPEEGRQAAEALAAQTGVELIDILPLGTVTDEQSERGYFALFRENVLAMASALGCEP